MLVKNDRRSTTEHAAGVGTVYGYHAAVGHFHIGQKTLVTAQEQPLLAATKPPSFLATRRR